MPSSAQSKSSRAAWLVAFLVMSLVCRISKARADQFIFNPRSICTNALNFIHDGSVVISFCSQCDAEHLEIWRVKQSFVADALYQDQFQLILVGKRLYRSRLEFKQGQYKEPVKFEKVPDSEKSLLVEGVDLAYLYVQSPDGTFHVLAKE